MSFYRTVKGVPQLIFNGPSEALYEYTIKFCIQALPQFVLVHQMGLGTFSDQLKSFRLTRAIQRGLDRVSKIRELSAIDFDSTIAKFPVAEFVG